MTDEELQAEVDAFLAEGGRGECEENDGTPEGQALWDWQHHPDRARRLVIFKRGFAHFIPRAHNEV